MLIVSTAKLAGNVKFLFPNIEILNLSSFNENYPRVALMPPPDLFCIGDDELDIGFFNYIFGNDYIFMELMKIIMPLYFGRDICILVTENETLDKITESILKIIQSRYGYNSTIVNTEEDILDLYNTYDTEDYSFSLEGLAMLDIDKEKYSYITAIQNGVSY